jgi:hypothetical protein
MSVLVDSARKSFVLIEPWSYAKSDHREVTTLISEVQIQVTAYYTAIDTSIGVAEQGYSFANDCYDLCEFLLDPQNSEKDLTHYVTDMREKAQTAYLAAKETSEKFRSVRRGLNEITSGIPAAVATVQAREEEQLGQEQYEEKRARRVIMVGGAVGAAGAALAGGAALLTGIAALHGLILFIPIILPLIALATKTVSDRYDRSAQDRGTQAISCSEAIAQLHKAATDLSELTRQMDDFADWWQEMDTMLKTIVSRISQLRADRVARSRLRIISIQKGWGQVRGQYLDYKTDISKLQDYYPSSRPKAIEN